jgi:FG-GAP repeat protein
VRFHQLFSKSSSALLLALLLSAVSLAQNVPSGRMQRLNSPHAQSENAPSVPSPGDWQQLAKLVSGRGEATEPFAGSVGISGDTVVVSASTDYVNAMAAYVFVKSPQGWGNNPAIAALRLPSPVDRFEPSVAIDGDTVVIGAAGGPDYPSYAYVFVKPAAGWTTMNPTAVLAAPDSTDGAFGQSVAISSDTIVVGDPGGNIYTSYNPGAVYVFVKPAGGWQDMTETAKLTASDGVLRDELGYSVAINGDTVAAGAPQYLETGPIGKAYVFVEPAGGWKDMTQTAELTAPDALSSGIGFSIALSANTVLAGSPFGDTIDGAAYVFTKPVSGWANMTETATLTPGDNQSVEGLYGWCVAISGQIAAVGSVRRGVPPFGIEGGVYVFTEPPGGWKNAAGTTVLTGSDTRDYSFFGTSLAVSGKMLVSGAQPIYIPGGAYVFGLP